MTDRGLAGRRWIVPRVVGTWVALIAGLLVGREIEDLGSLVVAAVVGAAIVFVGFAAAARCRQLPLRAPPQHMRLAMLSLAAGAALGLANLAANWGIAASHPTFRALLGERMTTLDPLEGLIASPIVEEILVRLFLLSIVAWIIWRASHRPQSAFVIALLASSMFFAALHLDRPMPQDLALATYYRFALFAKYTLAGMPLGWIFWRWGLPFAILCHIAANGVHLLVQQRVF